MFNGLGEQIERFQKLKDITGCSKISSYDVSISFSVWDDEVTVEVGGYDIGDWNRHTYLNTTKENLVEDFTKLVDKAVEVVNADEGEF